MLCYAICHAVCYMLYVICYAAKVSAAHKHAHFGQGARITDGATRYFAASDSSPTDAWFKRHVADVVQSAGAPVRCNNLTFIPPSPHPPQSEDGRCTRDMLCYAMLRYHA